MKRLLAVLALAAACSASALPAIADPAADALKAKLTSAMQGVKSFRVSVKPTAGGEAETRIGRGSVTTTMVLPDKMETAVDMSGMSVKMVVLGAESWMQMNGGAWNKMPRDGDRMGAMFKQIDAKKYMDQSVVKILPDEDFNGKKVGAFTGSSAGPQKADESVCNYDKTTYLLVRCHTATGTVLFSDFNNPANVIDVPK